MDFSNNQAAQIELCILAASGDLDGVRRSIVNGAEVDAIPKASAVISDQPGQAGMSALMHASKAGHVDVIRELLDAGANVNLGSKGIVISKRTALLFAVEAGQLDAAKLLLERGADPEVQDLDYSDGMNGHNSAMSLACDAGHAGIVDALLDAGVSVEKKVAGRTPVVWAAVQGHLEVVKLLLKRGAKIEGKDSGGNTPLLAACGHGRLTVVEHLLDRGARIDATNRDGDTPILIAFKWRSGVPEGASLMRLLIDRGGNPDAVNKNGESAIHVHARRTDVLPVLIDAGVDVNATKNDGETALHRVVILGPNESVQMLLTAGADPNPIAPSCGKTPLDFVLGSPGLDPRILERPGIVRPTNQELLVELLRRFGAKTGDELNIQPAPPAKREEPRFLDRPDLWATMDSDGYRTALKRVRDIVGSDVDEQLNRFRGETPTDRFLVLPNQREKVATALDAARDEFTSLGVSALPAFPIRGVVSVVPSTDLVTLLAAFQVGAPGGTFGSADIADRLLALNAGNRFVFASLWHNYLSIRFVSMPKSPGALAKSLIETWGSILISDRHANARAATADIAQKIRRGQPVEFYFGD